MKTKKVDFYASNQHCLIMLYPETDEAKEFCDNSLYVESWQNKNGIAIEPRYFEDIYLAIQNEVLTIKSC